VKPGFLIILLFAASYCRAADVKEHALDPLTEHEIDTTVEVLRAAGKVNFSTVFPEIALREPDKQAVLSGPAVPRRSFAVVYDRDATKTFEGVVDVRQRRLISWREIPGVQPAVLGDDANLADRIIRYDPRWRDAMRKRGLTNFESIAIDVWSAGYFGSPDELHGRLVRGVSYYRGKNSNYYARPIEGVVAYVDLTAKRVAQFIDTGVIPLPKEKFDYEDTVLTHHRGGLKQLRILQPGGPSYEMENGEVRWQNWRFRFSMHPREGLVLHLVRYDDGGRERSVLYRGSVAEMVVPYGDPGAGWFFRNSFDVGELGLGKAASPLRLGADCPENAQLFDAVIAGDRGEPLRLRQVAALYEVDAGIAWKHNDETRRARNLVLMFVASVGNYDYEFSWIFHQDGTLEVKVGLTGVMSVKAEKDHDPANGHMVAPSLSAVHHQHFFSFRLDLDVDGAAPNRVLELNTEAEPAGPKNPYKNAFHLMQTPLKTESEAKRHLNVASSRRWAVVNTQAKNGLGQPAGYLLLPGENAEPFAAPDSWVRRRAGFLNAQIWVTPYSQNEFYPAGDYPNQSRGGDGLPRWTAGNRPIDGKDVVVWYTMGITHNPRPEDWPVMPVYEAGFKLVPMGFFDTNPAIDLSPAR